MFLTKLCLFILWHLYFDSYSYSQSISLRPEKRYDWTLPLKKTIWSTKEKTFFSQVPWNKPFIWQQRKFFNKSTKSCSRHKSWAGTSVILFYLFYIDLKYITNLVVETRALLTLIIIENSKSIRYWWMWSWTFL